MRYKGVEELTFLLQETRIKVDENLKSILTTFQDKTPSRLYEAMKYSALAPGKRFRSFLLLEFGRAFGVLEKQLLQVAVALEFVNAYSLVHDDLPCMDDAALRRGQPTTHLKFDEATALLAGNSLLTAAFQLLTNNSTHEDSHVRLGLIMALTEACGPYGMMGGQMLDLLGEIRNFNLDEIKHMQSLKTGALLIFSCEAAAIMGNQEIKIIKAVRDFGTHLGLAFQITDDLLDYEGSTEKLGKPIGLDQQASKATFVKLLGIEEARSRAKDEVEQALQILQKIGLPFSKLEKATLSLLTRRI
jgi:farnesyl diphosphate synthase